MEESKKDIIKIFTPEDVAKEKPGEEKKAKKRPSLFMKKLEKEKLAASATSFKGFPEAIKLSPEEMTVTPKQEPSLIKSDTTTLPKPPQTESDKISQQNLEMLRGMPKEELAKLQEELKSLNLSANVLERFKHVKITDEVLYSKKVPEPEPILEPTKAPPKEIEPDTVLKINLAGEIAYQKEERRYLPTPEAHVDEISYLFCPLEDLMDDAKFYSVLEITYLLRSSFSPHNSLGLRLLNLLLQHNALSMEEIKDKRIDEIVLTLLSGKAHTANIALVNCIEKLISLQMKEYYGFKQKMAKFNEDIMNCHWRYNYEATDEGKVKSAEPDFVTHALLKGLILLMQNMVEKQEDVVGIEKLLKHLCNYSKEACESIYKSSLLKRLVQIEKTKSSLSPEFVEVMISLGKHKKEHMKHLYEAFAEFFKFPTLLAAVLKELWNEPASKFSKAIQYSFHFLSIAEQYTLIDMSMNLPVDIFVEIIKRVSTSLPKLTPAHEEMIAAVINFISQVAHRSIAEYDKLLKELLKFETPPLLVAACVRGLSIYYNKRYKNTKNSILGLTQLKETLEECYGTLVSTLTPYFEKEANLLKTKDLIEMTTEFTKTTTNSLVETLEIANAVSDYLKLLSKAKAKVHEFTASNLYIKQLKDKFMKLKRDHVKIQYPAKKSADLLSMHALKIFLIPLIKDCLLNYKLNQNLQEGLEIATKIVEYLNKNDEYVLSKLFKNYLFNSSIVPEFEKNKKEITALSEFFKGYTEPNLTLSRNLWKHSKALLSLDQPESGSFLPLRELWLINPALYIDPNGPPANSLHYYISLIRYLQIGKVYYTDYEKFCILAIVLTNYADFVGNSALFSAGKELAKEILGKSPLKLEYSSENIKGMKPFRLDSISDRLASCYSEISYNNPLLALLTFALLQKGIDFSIQKKVLSEIKPLATRMALNFEGEILGQEDWYIHKPLHVELENLYTGIEAALRKAGVSSTNKMYKAISGSLKSGDIQ